MNGSRASNPERERGGEGVTLFISLCFSRGVGEGEREEEVEGKRERKELNSFLRCFPDNSLSLPFSPFRCIEMDLEEPPKERGEIACCFDPEIDVAEREREEEGERESE